MACEAVMLGERAREAVERVAIFGREVVTVGRQEGIRRRRRKGEGDTVIV